MRGHGAPLRFIVAVLSLWGGARAFWLSGGGIESIATASRLPVNHHVTDMAAKIPGLFQWMPTTRPAPAVRPVRLTVVLPPPAPAPLSFWSEVPAFVHPVAARRDGAEILTPLPPQPQQPRLDLDHAVTSASRWSGSAWVYWREGSSGNPLATGGQLGGSQAGARVRWRINPGEQIRTAVYGRLSSPIDERAGAEAAVGAEWHPLPGQPLWVAAERRIALGRQGRNAWSAYAAGGVWKPGLPLGTTLDGYAQAGVVGARRRDLFADGAVRISRPLSTEDGVRIGAGVWGAAQPGTKRLDIGPHARVPLRVAKQPFSISADYRMRVAGDAAPGSGVAVTLASDF